MNSRFLQTLAVARGGRRRHRCPNWNFKSRCSVMKSCSTSITSSSQRPKLRRAGRRLRATSRYLRSARVARARHSGAKNAYAD
eukprot:2725921-Heterocapsa_arctica.AAC.1